MQEMATRDDVTVRIDTELRAKARELEINMSRLLEDALLGEIMRREVIGKTLGEGMREIRLNLDDYVGKFAGRLLGEGHNVEAYLTEDQRVIMYEPDRERYSEFTAADVEFSDIDEWFPHDPDVAAEAATALGLTPERGI